MSDGAGAPRRPATPEPLPRHRTSRPALDQRLVELLDEVGVDANRDQFFEILATVTRLADDHADRLDLKITNAALKEMRRAFRMFGPYRAVPKATIFGSARTLPEDPLYDQTRNLAAALADAGWMVITGAGPGIMAAGLEGAGRERSFGINIRLPAEQGANAFIASDPKLVEMKYFFTRKLMLMKESAAFVALPGGFGTLDEVFELLTLLQTGKANPSPVVLLDVPGGTYWRAFESFLAEEVATRGLIGSDDSCLWRRTDDVADATDEMLRFYRNYHSRRFVGDRMVIRLRAAPTGHEVAALDAEFRDICVSGGIERTDPLPAELADDDNVELPRLALHFDLVHHSRLRRLIDTLNDLPSAPRWPPDETGRKSGSAP